jgi:hypothetical protein
VQQADILQSRALDKTRSEKENGSSVNYESAVSEIAIMTMMKLDRLIPCKRIRTCGSKRKNNETHFKASDRKDETEAN